MTDKEKLLYDTLRFYADRRNHSGVGTSSVFKDNGRKARIIIGVCKNCELYGDGFGEVKTGNKIMDQDGPYDEYILCRACNGSGIETDA